MTYQWSTKLADTMAKYQDDTPIDLAILAGQVAAIFEKHTTAAKSLLSRCSGRMAPGTLCRYLTECVVHDSAVRDMLTVGHLAKLLTRMNTLEKTGDARIVGLPNALFDECSQAERGEFMAGGNILPIDAEVLKVEGVQLMLQQERSALSASSK